MTNTMVLPSPAQQTSEGETSRKRRRIIQACEECRDRKRKCDGVRPVCGACSRRPGQSCVWNDDRNTKGWSNKYVFNLTESHTYMHVHPADQAAMSRAFARVSRSSSRPRPRLIRETPPRHLPNMPWTALDSLTSRQPCQPPHSWAPRHRPWPWPTPQPKAIDTCLNPRQSPAASTR